MTSAQKVIKYIAIAFAIFLIITIISSILSGIYALSNILGLKREQEIITSEMNTTNFENSNIQSLKIDVSYTNLIIKNGNSLKIETNNNNIKFNHNGKELELKEKNYRWLGSTPKGDLIVYLPEDTEFEKIRISAGAGKISIEKLMTKDLKLELGAGEASIKQLNVLESCNIDGGAGKVNIESGIINDFDLDMGVGETNINALLTGKSDIDAGIGNLNIMLNGSKEDYKINTEKGIGTVRIDGDSISNNQTFGNGDNLIKIDGGIGNISIKFNK